MANSYEYTDFKPQNSALAQRLSSMSTSQLITRYLKPKMKNQKDFTLAFKEVVDSVDSNRLALYPNVIKIQGKNLNYIGANLLHRVNPDIDELKYQFNMTALISDLNTLLGTSKIKLTQSTMTETVTKYIQDIAQFYVKDIIIDQIVLPLQISKENSPN